MTPKLLLCTAFSAAWFGLAGVASATGTVTLDLPQATAFTYLGHSCGGIQERSYVTGFDATTGLPTGDVYLTTHCNGSGHSSPGTTYSEWIGVTWDFAGNVVASSPLGAAPTVDPNLFLSNGVGATISNALDHAYLTVVLPGVAKGVSATLVGGQVRVSWTPDASAAPEITSTTITATPIAPAGAPVQATVTGPVTSALVSLASQTKYVITVVNNDLAGAGPVSEAVHVRTGASTVTPPAPTGVFAWWTGQLPPGSSLGVRWNATSAGFDTIDAYEVRVVWQDGDNTGGTYDQTFSGTTLSAYFPADNTSDWRIQVRAHDAAGWGPWSSAITIGGV